MSLRHYLAHSYGQVFIKKAVVVKARWQAISLQHYVIAFDIV